MTNRELLNELKKLTDDELEQEVMIDVPSEGLMSTVRDAGLTDLYDQDKIEETRFIIEVD